MGKQDTLQKNCTAGIKYDNQRSVNAISEKPPARCYNCGSINHFAKRCPDKREPKEQRMVTQYNNMRRERELKNTHGRY